MDGQPQQKLKEARRRVRRQQQRIADLKKDNRGLTDRVAQLEEDNRRLQEQLERALRAAARQAAPFRRRPEKKIPSDQKKRPGRKAGHPGACRATPEQIDEVIEVPLDQCPHCHSQLPDGRQVVQIIEEIPPTRPRTVKLITYCVQCERCGRTVRSSHPLQTSLGQGAAKVQLGPRALALAADLNKGHGLTIRKTCAVLKDLTGLSLTPGGLSHALSRVAKRVNSEYEQLVEDVRASPAVFADETSWWVGGPGWWLWGFTTADTTVYHVDESRGSKVVEEILGSDFAGMLVSDCLSSYDPPSCRKHKCIAHHLRAISKAEQLPGTTDLSYLRQWKLLLQATIAVYGCRGWLTDEEFSDKRGRIEAWADRLLAEPRSQPGDIKVRNRLSKQRAHLFGCLYEPAAEPTNNRAERCLRPAVIARKVSCGNKTERGRACWQILASLAATCRQRAKSFVEFLAPRLSLAAEGR